MTDKNKQPSADGRELVFGMLMNVIKEGLPSHLVLADTLAKYAYLEKQERAFITRLMRGTLQNILYLDEMLLQCAAVKTKTLKKPLRIILYMGAYQILQMDSVPDSAAVNESVKLARRHGFRSMSGFVNAVLRSLSRKKEQVVPPDPDREPAAYLAFAYSLPVWIGEMWLARYDFETCRRMAAFMQEAPQVTVRVRHPEETEAVIESLQEAGVTVQKGQIFPWALHLRGIDSVPSLKAFSEGRITVQDEGAMLAAVCAGIRGGERIIDLCAAPGGKSLHMADLLEENGSISARDISKAKTDKIEENLRRAGVGCVQTMVCDASVCREEDLAGADIVMADLPCSGLGVIGRKPDIRYQSSPEKIASLAELQKEILTASRNYVRPGGVLVYCTCTVSESENEKIRAWMLEDGSFVQDSLDPFLPEQMRSSQTADGHIQILPGRYGTDGFYIARFRRCGGENCP